MNALKDKIFEVLTERITPSKFENWLYNSEEFLNQVSSNPFIFDVVSVNYKSKEWSQKLNILTKEYHDNNYLEILRIRQLCIKIIETETIDETYQILITSMINFDYDTDYSILWKFYSFNDYFGLVKDGIWNIGTLQIELKFYAKQTLFIIKECKKFNDVKIALANDLKPFEPVKVVRDSYLKRNLFAFFKKI